MFLFLFLFCSVFSSQIETELFQNGNIQLAMNLDIQEPIDYALKYFLLKQFANQSNSAIFTSLSAHQSNEIVLLLLGRNNPIETQLSLSTSSRVHILQKIGEKISALFFENKYNFRELTLLDSLVSQIDAQDVLKNLRGRDDMVIAKFFYYVESRVYLLKNVIPELQYLASKGNITAFYYLGYAYFTGSGVEKDIDKAFEYFWASRNSSKSSAFLGIGKILMKPEYNYIEEAINSFRMAKSEIPDSEVDYCLHLLLEVPNNLNFNECEFLKKSAISGYLPAVQKFTNYYIKEGLIDNALFSLMSITQYSPFFIEYDDKAFNYFLNKEFKKACLIYLFLSEFNLHPAILNSINLMENYKLFENQDLILFRLYKQLALTNPSYNKKLGDCYYYGRGVEQSYESAYYSYAASRKYNTEGAYCAAYMLEMGKGIPKNLLEARRIILKYLNSESLYLVKFYSYLRVTFKIVFQYYSIHLAILSTLLCLSSWKLYPHFIRVINK